MKILMAASLILLGAFWILYATITPEVMKTRAMSDAMQLEANLKAWMTGKIHEGKLQESDIGEIFPEDYSLRFGGENPGKSFRQMISDISQSGAPPAWPGLFSILIGGAGAISCLGFSKKNKGEQADAGNRAEPGA